MASTGLNIAALARRTGVRPDTLRKWEQRYGILRPERTPGGQRRYGEDDVARVEWLKARLGEGYRIGEAATLLGASANRAVGRTAEELRSGILAALETADADAVEQLLDQALLVFPLDQALTDVIFPTLRTVGDRWEKGLFSVAQEHLLSIAVRARLERLLADGRASVRGVAVLACAPGEQHDIGLLTLAVSLRADGWRVVYLGAATPYADAVDLAGRVDARVLCLSATTAGAAAALEESAGAGPPAAAKVVIGGAAIAAERARRMGGRYLKGDLIAVVERLRSLAA